MVKFTFRFFSSTNLLTAFWANGAVVVVSVGLSYYFYLQNSSRKFVAPLSQNYSLFQMFASMCVCVFVQSHTQPYVHSYISCCCFYCVYFYYKDLCAVIFTMRNIQCLFDADADALQAYSGDYGDEEMMKIIARIAKKYVGCHTKWHFRFCHCFLLAYLLTF